MKWHTIPPLVAKDLRLFFRNRFYAFITVISLFGFVGIYFFMPRTVDEVLRLGLFAPTTADAVERLANEEGVAWLEMDTDAALRQAVLAGDVAAGIALPADLLEAFAKGQRPTVQLYLPSDATPETRDMMVIVVEGLALSLSGSPLNIDVHEETLGPDLAGAQIAPRDRMLPLLAIAVLMVETLGLASLIAEEVQTGTLRALLVTPMGVPELFVGKGITSVGMTFTQTTLLMLLIGGLRHQPLIVLAALFLGSLLVTAIGFLMASAGRDMLSVMGWGILAMIVLAIPTFGVVFPGTVTQWAKVIPSYYLAEVVQRVTNLGAGWAQVWPSLLMLLGVDALFFVAGAAALQRRFR
jgi:ABC-2 type transport system permease protein